MPRKKAVVGQSLEVLEPPSQRKRSYSEIEPDATTTTTTTLRDDSTPTRRPRGPVNKSPNPNGVTAEFASEASASVNLLGEDVEMSSAAQELEDTPSEAPTPTPRKRGRPPKNPPSSGNTPTPKASRLNGPKTPTKSGAVTQETPGRKAGADRSARRKSARALIEQVVGDGDSAEEEDDEEGGLAREIYDSSDADDDAEGEFDTPRAGSVSGTADDTPSKGTPKQRRARKKARSPTPPRDLPAHEMYFVQNKPGRPKTSDNNLAALKLLTHEEYFEIMHGQEDRHKSDVEYLEGLHAESFPQWIFELAEGFGICLYGFGSKRSLMLRFAKEMHARGAGSKPNKIVIVNGYAPTTTMREILSTVALAVDPSRRIPTASPAIMLRSILSHLSTTATSTTLTLLINSIDAVPLRKPGHQSILAQLASHPRVQLVCSTDTPDFPVLWDVGLRSAFNFAFHDATTFAPFKVELDVVDDVHELLGRKSRRVNGREGVAFVLRSLPENAKNLFQLIVGEVLIAMEEESGGAGDGDVGVEYRMIYNKAVEEFICSSEMAFRTLLKE